MWPNRPTAVPAAETDAVAGSVMDGRGGSDRVRPAVALFLGASAMFANMYATQAILPDIEHALNVSPAAAGLSITVVVIGVAIGSGCTGRSRTGSAAPV